MFNTGSQPTITKSVVELADSALESANCSADPVKVGVWVRDFSVEAWAPTSQGKVFLV